MKILVEHKICIRSMYVCVCEVKVQAQGCDRFRIVVIDD